MKVPKCLSKVAPKWSNKIKKAKKLSHLFKKEFMLDMDDQRFCIVGEARLFSADYSQMGSKFCKTCDEFCNAFARNASPYPMHYYYNKKLDNLSYSQLIERFCKHMMLKHKRDVRATQTQERIS